MPLIPAPGAPVVIAGTCGQCGVPTQRAQGSAHDCRLCARCCPDMAAGTAVLKAKIDQAVANLAASVSPSGRSGNAD